MLATLFLDWVPAALEGAYFNRGVGSDAHVFAFATDHASGWSGPAVLVVAVVLAALLGLALARRPERPRLAFVTAVWAAGAGGLAASVAVRALGEGEAEAAIGSGAGAIALVVLSAAARGRAGGSKTGTAGLVAALGGALVAGVVVHDALSRSGIGALSAGELGGGGARVVLLTAVAATVVPVGLAHATGVLRRGWLAVAAGLSLAGTAAVAVALGLDDAESFNVGIDRSPSAMFAFVALGVVTAGLLGIAASRRRHLESTG